MVSGLQKRLRALREIAPQLNEAADEANRIVASVEKQLRDMNLGVTAASDAFDVSNEEYVDEDSDEKVFRETSRHLVFGRLANKLTERATYQIHVLELTSQGVRAGELDLVSEDRIHWSSCDRETRTEALSELANLLDILLAKATKKLDATKRAAEAVKEITEDKGD